MAQPHEPASPEPPGSPRWSVRWLRQLTRSHLAVPSASLVAATSPRDDEATTWCRRHDARRPYRSSARRQRAEGSGGRQDQGRREAGPHEIRYVALLSLRRACWTRPQALLPSLRRSSRKFKARLDAWALCCPMDHHSCSRTMWRCRTGWTRMTEPVRSLLLSTISSTPRASHLFRSGSMLKIAGQSDACARGLRGESAWHVRMHDGIH